VIGELDQISLFKDLPYDCLEDISKFCARVHFEAGEFLIVEGDSADPDLFILSDGSVEIVSNNSDRISNEIVLSKEQKEIFGEISWLTNAKRTASVRCHDQVDAIRIDGKALMSYLEERPEAGFIITRKVANLLSKRMEETDKLLKQVLWNRHI